MRNDHFQFLFGTVHFVSVRPDLHLRAEIPTKLRINDPWASCCCSQLTKRSRIAFRGCRLRSADETRQRKMHLQWEPRMTNRITHTILSYSLYPPHLQPLFLCVFECSCRYLKLLATPDKPIHHRNDHEPDKDRWRIVHCQACHRS